MIRIRRGRDRGHADHGWLRTAHTFSFADYFDPEHTRFGVLRVLNQDVVAPGGGFATHAHDNMEIVSVVLDGVLEHRDSMGNGSQIRPGEVQLMSAGRGVTHSEFNGADAPLHFLQMWVFPRDRDTEPRYEQRRFADDELGDALRLVVSPDGADGSLTIGQDARLRYGRLGPGATVTHALPAGRAAWLHVARGAVRVDDERLEAGDGAALEEPSSVTLAGDPSAEVVLWELPAPSSR